MNSFQNPVAALCVGNDSAYKRLAGVEAFDLNRDCRTFAGGMPIVAHPPCKHWSAFCRHQAAPSRAEAELGLICAAWLIECGGVLEQPAYSHLFATAGLPKPGCSSGELFTISLWQAWFDCPVRKATWLCFCRVKRERIIMPFALHAGGGDRRCWTLMSRVQRSATTPAFAAWLVSLARTVEAPL